MERKNNTNFHELSCSDVSQSIDFHFLGYTEQIEKLHSSYNLMKNFLEGTKDDLNFNFNNILSKYAERQIEIKHISKNVMDIIGRRIQKMIKSKKLKKNWSAQDTQVLFWTFCHYSHLNDINSVEDATQKDWQSISNLIPGSNSDGCMFKILSLKKIRLISQKWTQLENALLLQIVTKKKQKNWRTIAQQLYKRSQNPKKIFRNAKQCKQHWLCYLNPGLKKGSWSIEEDIRLLNFVLLNNGARRWAYIAKVFGGRTQNALKNRYNLIINQLKYDKLQESQLSLIRQHLKKLQVKRQEQLNIQIKQSNANKKQSQLPLIQTKENIQIKQKEEIPKNIGFIIFPINNATLNQGVCMNQVNNYWNYQYFNLNLGSYQP